ncbi:SH3 and multiple ankyrin repeat domains protein 2 [Triplophysa tibetana]|uniref:SH3 and multiple ankyrin repeat domains protein 2 n=1 Tax=Triplophysa tibetana TaxID=1572043 RepID=A0A5A9NY48_9TELE|nr:SH3 and multiple ankyrin repeat domains protein 2 [Triplophysa tibetana]
MLSTNFSHGITYTAVACENNNGGARANCRINCQSSRRKLGRQFVAIQPYLPKADGEISLHKNDKVKVLSVGEGGYWEGSCRGHVGWFPARCVEEFPVQADKGRLQNRTECNGRKKLFRHFTVGSYDSFDAFSDFVTEQKTVILHKKENEGFGFVLRGAKVDREDKALYWDPLQELFAYYNASEKAQCGPFNVDLS